VLTSTLLRRKKLLRANSNGDGFPGQTVWWHSAPGNLLPPGFSLTRADPGTYYDSAGLLQTAAIDAARGTYRWNGSAFAFDGTIVEAASTNLVVQSETMTIANGWADNSGVATETTGVTDPAGTTKAVTLTGTGGNPSNGRYRVVTFTSSGTKGVSVFIKQGSAVNTRFWLYDYTAVTARHDVFVTWSGGVPSMTTNAGGGTLYAPEQLADGWWRLSITATGVVHTNTNGIVFYADRAGTNLSTTWYGSQCEDSSPTSYIPTTTVAVTRAADVPTAPTAGLLVNGQGFAAIGFRPITAPSTCGIISTYAAGGGIPLWANGGALTIYDGTNRSSQGFSPVVGTAMKLASTWAGTACNTAVNGAVGTPQTFDGSMDFAATIQIGNNPSGLDFPLSMVLQSLRLGTREVSSFQLASFTAP